MTLAFFCCLFMMRKKNVFYEDIQDLSGLSANHPILSISLLIILFSLAGIPPLAGFFAKFYIFMSVIEQSMYFLAIVGLLSTVVAAFYYLRIVWYMYFEKNELPIMKGSPNIFQKISISLMGLSILLLGLYPSPIINFCRSIIPPFLLID